MDVRLVLAVERKTGRVQMYKPRGEPKLFDCVCRRVLKQLGNPILAGLIERSSPRMVLKMLRLDSLPDQAPGG